MGFKVRLSCTAGPLDPVKTDMIAEQGQLTKLIPGTNVTTALLISLADVALLDYD